MATTRPAQPSELFPVIYDELRRVARRYLGRERRNHTLQPTALVNEGWLRLQNDRGDQWQGHSIQDAANIDESFAGSRPQDTQRAGDAKAPPCRLDPALDLVKSG